MLARRATHRSAWLMTVVLACAACAGRSAPPPPTMRADASEIAAMKARLRTLVTAQESYYKGHASYTTDLAVLGLSGTSRPASDDQVVVRVTHATARSWIGQAEHRQLKGKSCVIWVGRASDFPTPPLTRADRIIATRGGAPFCDAP